MVKILSVAKMLPHKPKLALSKRLACQPQPPNGNHNLPNRGVCIVAQNQEM